MLSARQFLLTFACILAALPLLSCFQKFPSHPVSNRAGIENRSMNEDILSYVNQYRQSKGLAALQMNNILSSQAEIHSKEMAEKKTPFGHEGFENRVRIISQAIGPVHASAENVAYGNLNAREVVDGWLKSTGHRRNIEGNYLLTGIGVVKSDDGTLFFTQIFTTKP